MSAPGGGATADGGKEDPDDEELEVKVDGVSFTLATVGTISNPLQRAEAKISLNRQRKKLPVQETLPIKVLDAHGNKISASATDLRDSTMTVDIEKIQKRCLGLTQPSFIRRVKTEFELRLQSNSPSKGGSPGARSAAAIGDADDGDSTSRPGTAPVNFLRKNRDNVTQSRLSERQKVFDKLQEERRMKEARIAGNLLSARRERAQAVLGSGVSYLNKVKHLQAEGKLLAQGVTPGGMRSSGSGGKGGVVIGQEGDAQRVAEQPLTEAWRQQKWYAFLLAQSFASITHRLLIYKSPDARRRYNEGKWMFVVRIWRFTRKLKSAVYVTRMFRFLFRILRVRYKLLALPRQKKKDATRVLRFLERTTPAVPIIKGVSNFFATVKKIQTTWRAHWAKLKKHVVRGSEQFEKVEMETLRELFSYVQIERPVVFAPQGATLLGKKDPKMIVGTKLLKERELFVAEYAMPVAVRDAFVTAELAERAFLRAKRKEKERAALASGLGFVKEYTSFWRPTFDVPFLELLRGYVGVEHGAPLVEREEAPPKEPEAPSPSKDKKNKEAPASSPKASRGGSSSSSKPGGGKEKKQKGGAAAANAASAKQGESTTEWREEDGGGDTREPPCSFRFTRAEMEAMVVACHKAMGLLPDVKTKLRDEIDHDPNGFQTENSVEFRDRYFNIRKQGTDCRSCRERLRRREQYWLSRGKNGIGGEEEGSEKVSQDVVTTDFIDGAGDASDEPSEDAARSMLPVL
ncbi:unnamed protein product [Amoebophrya sp. A25]|nr:unnamed protein product [Amoebophrya sp. A25]|eukprot:GSA25T00009253001.1